MSYQKTSKYISLILRHHPEVIGITDDAVIQLRMAVYGVGTGEMTIDDAIAAYGTFTQ